MESICQVYSASVTNSVYFSLENVITFVRSGWYNVFVVSFDGCVERRCRHHHFAELFFRHFVFELDWCVIGFKGGFRWF